MLLLLQSLYLLGKALRLTSIQHNPDPTKLWEFDEMVSFIIEILSIQSFVHHPLSIIQNKEIFP